MSDEGGIADRRLQMLSAVGGGFASLRSQAHPTRSHGPRGNAVRDALRPLPCPWDDAERRRRHSHAERGNEFPESEPEPRPRASSCFPTPFTAVYRCWKHSVKLPFPPLFGRFGPACRRQGSLGNTLQHHEIGHDAVLGRAAQNRVGRVHRKCHTKFRWLFTILGRIPVFFRAASRRSRSP